MASTSAFGKEELKKFTHRINSSNVTGCGSLDLLTIGYFVQGLSTLCRYRQESPPIAQTCWVLDRLIGLAHWRWPAFWRRLREYTSSACKTNRFCFEDPAMLGDGDCVKVLRGHQDRVRALELSSCGTVIFSAGDDGLILKWDVASGEQLKVLRGHNGVVWALAMDRSSSTLYSGSADCTVRAWDTVSGECIKIISEQRGWVRTLALNAVPSEDSMELQGGNQPAEDVHESLYTGSLNWFIEARNTATNQVLHRIPSGVGRLDLIHALAVSEDGRMLYSAGTGCTIRGWDTRTAQCQKLLEGHTDTVFSIILTSEERLWSSGGDRTIRAWRLMDSACIQVIKTPNVPYTLCLHEDENTLFSAPFGNGGIAAWEMDKKIKLINRRSMSEFYPKTADDDSPALDECSAVLEGHEPGESIHALALSREFGKLFSAGGDCTVRVWQVGVPKFWSMSLHMNFPLRFRMAVREVMKLAAPCRQYFSSPQVDYTPLSAVGLRQDSGAAAAVKTSIPDREDRDNILRQLHSLEPKLLEEVVHRMAADFIEQR